MMADPQNAKCLTPAEAGHRAAACRQRGQTVVFTNGCFDLLHAGHVHYLQAARAAGNVLFVGLNSDVSVRAIKDPGRPLNGQAHRAAVLAGLSCVDVIVLFDEHDPLKLIETIAPDVLAKGADWPETAIVGADFVKSRGGRVLRVGLAPELSTTTLIQRILKRYGQAGEAAA